MKKNRLIAGRVLLSGLSTIFLASCGGGSGGSSTPPPPTTYSLSASVSGLVGAGLALAVNGGKSVAVGQNGTVSLASGLSAGASYAVTVVTQPTNPAESCSVGNGSGAIAQADITNITVTCTATPTNTQLSADPSIPSSITSTITSVVSAQGSGALSGQIPVDLTGPTGDTLVVAVDAKGEVVLAAPVDSTSGAFSADSTALACVRLWLEDGVTNAGMKASDINAAIRSTTGYSALVTQVSKDLAAGVRPLSDATVDQELFAVAMAAEAALPAAAYATSTADSIHLKDIDTPTATSLPFVIAAGVTNPKTGLNTAYFEISGQSGQNIVVQNGTPMQWTVNTTIATLGAADKPLSQNVTLPGDGKSANVLGYNSPFNVNISQSVSDIQEAENSVFADMITTATGPLLGTVFKGCTGDLIKGAVDTAVKPVVVNGTNFHGVVAALPANVSGSTVTSVLQSCSIAWASQSITGAVLVTATVGVYIETLEAVSVPFQVIDGILLIGKMNTMEQLFGKTFSAGVCAANDYSIVSCVASFGFSPNQLIMAPGATQSVAVTGFDSSQPTPQQTPLPGDLQIRSESSSIASVAGNSSFMVTAVAPGSTTIAVLDPSTGATNVPPALNATPFQVTVAQPTLTPSATAIAVSSYSQTLTASLTGPKGEPPCGTPPVEPCINLPSGITWQPSSGTSMETPVTISGSTATWTIPASAPAGQFSVSASDASGNSYGTANITLFASPNFSGTLQGTLSLQGGQQFTCVQGGSQLCPTTLTFSVTLSDNQIANPAPTFSIGTGWAWNTTGWALLKYPWTGSCVNTGPNTCFSSGTMIGAVELHLSFGVNPVYTSDSVNEGETCDVYVRLQSSGGSTVATALSRSDFSSMGTDAYPTGTMCEANDGYWPATWLNSDVALTWSPSQ